MTKKEEQIDIFRYQLGGLKRLGLRRDPETRVTRILLNCYRVFMAIFLNYFLVMYIFFIADHYDDFMEIALSVTSLGVDIISVAKVFTLWFYRDRFYALLEKIQQKAFTSERTKQANRISGAFSKIFMWQLAVAASLYNATPLSLNIYNSLMYGSEWNLDMPLKFKVLYDISKSPIYEFTYFTAVIDIYTISFICFSIDSIFLICCMNIGAYFEILRDEIESTEKKEFVRHHQETLAIAKELNDIFMPIIFVEFVIIAIVLCGIGVTLVMARSPVEMALVIGYGNAMLIQLFFYCYSGQYLMDRSVRVTSEMYELDVDYRMVIMRTQRMTGLRAPFFKATLEQFASVLNMTWGLISVLKSSLE